MEALRADLINAIKRSVDPKWKTITCSMICCCNIVPTSVQEMSSHDAHVNSYEQVRDSGTPHMRRPEIQYYHDNKLLRSSKADM